MTMPASTAAALAGFGAGCAAESRAGASEVNVTGAHANTARVREREGPSDADGGDDLAREPLEALRRRVVAVPEDELSATGVDVPLHLLRDLFDRADEVVAHVLLRIAAAPQRSAAG